MKTVNINGKDFTLEELASLIEKLKIESKNPMIEVYKFHKTTEEEFDELYKNIPIHIKAHAQEEMVVNFYNKGKVLISMILISTSITRGFIWEITLGSSVHVITFLTQLHLPISDF